MSKFLNVREVADLVGLSRDTIRNLVKAGQFPQPIHIGSSVRFDEDEVTRFIASKKSERGATHE